MTSHIGGIFRGGPVWRVLELAAAVRESQGTLSLDEELRRFVRTVGMTRATDWACPIDTVTALFDHVADLCSDGTEVTPPAFREVLGRAGAGTDVAAFLRSLAAKLLALGPPDDYDVLPLSRWEIDVRFPRLAGFGVNWVYDGEYATLRDSAQAAIESEHPYCREFLAPLAAEAQSALVLFPGEQEMASGLTPFIGWASPEAVHHLLQAINDHMQREHSVLP